MRLQGSLGVMINFIPGNDIFNVIVHTADRKSNRCHALNDTTECSGLTYQKSSYSFFFLFFFWEGNKAFTIPIPLFMKNSSHLHTLETHQTHLKIHNLDKKPRGGFVRENEISDNSRRNTWAEQIKANKEREKLFWEMAGKIISYTMSNTESWAWANPATKKLRAASQTRFNASQSGPSVR